MNNFAATFSHELNSMHREARPCSKSRLEHLGELSALAIKDYKQVVYDVENFINTCHDEHKLAGVYVMDAILKRARQAKNSSYATKFARNIYLNMQHIFMRAKLSHKPKIVRVLNIWQKNQIFPPEIIQPMLDLANPNAKFEPKVCTLSTSPLPLIAMRYTRPTPCGSTTTTTVSSSAAWLNNKNASANNNSNNNNNNGNNTTSTAGCTTMVSSITYGDYKNQMRDNGQATSGGANNGKHGHGSVGTASMTMTTTTTKTTTATSASTSMSWSRRHKGEVAAPAAAAAAADDLPKSEEEQMTELVQLLHKMIKATGLNWENLTPEDIEKSMRLEARIQAGEQLEQEDWEDDEELGTPTEAEPRYSKPKNGENGRMPIDKRQVVAKIGELRQISLLVQNLFANQDFINQIQAKAAQAQLSDRPFLENVMEMMKIGQMVQPMFTQKIMDLAGFRAMIKTCLTVAIEASEKAALAAAAAAAAAAAEAEAAAAAQNTNGGQFHSTFQPISSAGDVDDRQQEQQQQQQSSTQRSGRHYSRSRSPSRSREYRSSGRSRDYDQRSSRLPPELDYREDSPYTAHQKERKRKGLPPIRPKFMSVCSTTLWVGHLPKYVSENDVADLFDKYGLVSNIDLIPSRGCAFVSMNRRQDATKAYNGLKAEPRVSGYTVKCAWAPGKGMKEKKYKDYWEADVGCSYIPFSMLHTEIDLDELEEGGVIDDETVPQPLKAAHQARVAKKEAEEKEKSQMLKSIQYTTVTTPATVAPAMVALPGLGLASVNALGMPVLGVPPQLFGPVLGAPPPPPPPPPPAVPMVPSYPPPPMPSYRPAVAGPPILPPPPPGVMHHHPIPPPMHGPMHGGGPPPGYHPGPGPMGHPPPPLPPPPGVMPPHLQQPPPPALLPRPAKVSRWGMMTNEKHAKSKQLGAPSPKKAKLAPTLSAMSDTNSSKLSPEAGPAVPKLGKISFNLKTTKSVLAKLDKREEEVSDDKSEPIARDNVDDDNDKEKMFIDNDDDKEITELVIDETAEDHDDEDDRNSVEVEKQHNDMDISIDSPGGRSTKITEHEHGNGGEGHAGSTNDDDADEEKTAAADGHKRGKKPKRTLLPLVEEPAASMYNPQLHVPEQQYHGPRHAFAPHMQHPRPEEFFGPPGMGPPPPPPGRPDFEMFHGNGEYNPPPPPMGPFPPGPNHLRAGFGHPMPPPRHNARPDGMFGPRMPHRFNDGPRFPNGGGPGPFFDGPRARFMPPNEPHMFGRNMPMPPEMFGPYDGPPEMYFDGPPPPGPHGGPPPHLVHGPRPRWDRPPQPFWQQQQQPGGPRGHPRNMRPPWQAAQRFEGGGGQQRRAENGKLNGGQHKEAKPKSTNIFDNPVEGLDEIDEVAAEDNGHEVQGPT